MSFNVQRNSSEDGKNGRMFIGFVGLITVSTLQEYWKNHLRDKYQSTLDVIDEMESIKLCEYDDGSSHMTTFSMKQVEIARACGIETPYECLPSSLKKGSNKNKFTEN